MNVFDHLWWQRGPLLTCGHASAFPLCVADNLAHYAYRARLVLRRRTGWQKVCPTVPQARGVVGKAHARAVERALRRKHPEYFTDEDVT